MSDIQRPAAHVTAGPCVERLERDLAGASGAAGRAELLAEFWAAAERRGTPLVAEIEGDPGHRAVTFLWRGGPDDRMLVALNRVAVRDDPAASLMRRLPGTDVWHLTYRLRADHRGSYRMAPAGVSGPAALAGVSDRPSDPRRAGVPGGELSKAALMADGRPDPLNPHRLASRWGRPDASVVSLPAAPPQPWADRRAGIPRGEVHEHRLPAGVLGAERTVWAYVPPGGVPSGAPVAVLCDGDMWFGGLAFQDTLDALIADGAVPPLVVVAPDSAGNDVRWAELGAREPYVSFLADEVLGWASERWPITRDPARTVVAGQSLGGMAALYAGLLRPERFGNVLAQSASLWWRPGLEPGVPKLAPAGPPWLAGRFAEDLRRPIRVRLDVGLHEGPMAGYARDLDDVLRSRGCPVVLTEYNGGHDYACWRGSLADGLIALLTP
ncbi:alpha/beta hydrolase-fold protein [Nonomuraea rosea]|uniref:Alpha/beta hydrolase-fold protein n=1 Tax=Nonomuraea rosea TaxID=638574 RepID=A0ABP6XNF0_9ACTN